MPPRVPGYTLSEVLRAFHTDGWTISEGSKIRKPARATEEFRYPGIGAGTSLPTRWEK